MPQGLELAIDLMRGFARNPRYRWNGACALEYSLNQSLGTGAGPALLRSTTTERSTKSCWPAHCEVN